MGKIIFIVLLFFAKNISAQTVLDSVVIYDYKTANRTIRQSGIAPTYFTISGIDTLVLDANNVKAKRFKSTNQFSSYYIVPSDYYLVGVKVYFPKDSVLHISLKAQNEFAKKFFSLDTILQITNQAKRPLIFWAMSRQASRNTVQFLPVKFTVTNEDFDYEHINTKKRRNMLENCIRYTYNTVTKELIDKWQDK